MDEDLMMSLLLQSAQQKDHELKSFSTRLQANRIAQAFRRLDVLVALYPANDEAGTVRYMLMKGTEEKLRTKVQVAARAVQSFCPLRPTWFALQFADLNEARMFRDSYELRLYEAARNTRPSKAAIEFSEEMSPRGRNTFAQTKIPERYTQHVRSLGLTLRKIRLPLPL